MNHKLNQVQDTLEQWFGIWLKLTLPIRTVTTSAFFHAYLQDSQESYNKAMKYWSEKPEDLQSKVLEWNAEFQSIFPGLTNKNVDQLDNSALLENILEIQKVITEKVSTLIDETEILDSRESMLLKFNLRQLMAFTDPRNSFFLNPETIQKGFDIQGTSFFPGFNDYLQNENSNSIDLQVERTNTDENPAGEKLGVSIAATKGAVIFENELIQLIHYEAHQESQNEIPILIVPSCINKFYVLDLLPENSLVHWLCEQGHDVYMLSWVNPDSNLAGIGFDDYIESCLVAIDVVSDFVGVERINILGYCIGGLIASIAAASRRGQKRTNSLTLIATMLDYPFSGELGIFTSPRILDLINQEASAKGILKSEFISLLFTLMREDKLFWRYIRQHYYLGEDMSEDSFVTWCKDGTSLPARMVSEYLGFFYEKNGLYNDKYYQFSGESVSLFRCTAQKYILACEADHMAPAKSVLNDTKLLAGNLRAVVASGDHFAGVVNHPAENRGSFKLVSLDTDSCEQECKGSWWVDWQQWLSSLSGEKVMARSCSNEKYPAIELAPGKFVRMQ